MLEMDKFVNASKRNNIQKVKFSCEHPGFLTFHAILFNLSIKSSFSPSPCSCLCPAGSSPSSSSPWTPPSTTCRRRLCRCGQTQRIPFERTKNIFSYCLITQRLFFILNLWFCQTCFAVSLLVVFSISCFVMNPSLFLKDKVKIFSKKQPFCVQKYK